MKIKMDTWRFILAIMIVSIHTFPFAFINGTFDYLITRVICRIAVPLFLMITGYFILPKALEDKTKLTKYLQKILKIYFVSILIYLPLNIYNGYFQSADIFSIFKDVIFNGTFYHLWYFPALIIGLLITYILIKKLPNHLVFIITCLLYLIGLFGDSYYGLINLTSFYEVIFYLFDYTRNGLFMCPIFLFLGYYYSQNKMKLSWRLSLIFLPLFLAEGYILYYFDVPRHNSMYLFLVPLVYSLFSLITQNRKENLLFRHLSLELFIWHPFFIAALHMIQNKVNMAFLSNSFINFILVLILTIIFILILTKIKEYTYGKFKEKSCLD